MAQARRFRWVIGLGVGAALAFGPASTEAQEEPASAASKGRVARPKLSERRGDGPASAPTPAPTAEKAPKPEAKLAARPEEPAPPGMFGDPKKFTRLGGWGSFGTAMGQFGFAKSTLIMMPPVQAELKLTDEQKEKLKVWQDGLRKSGEEMGKSMREKGGADPLRGNDNLSIGARVVQFSGMINQIGNLVRQNESTLASILNAPQRKRLNQISLQMEGISALSRPEIAEALGLTDEERESIQQILNQSRAQQMTTWIGSMMAMRQARPGPGGGDPRANPAKAGPKAEKAEATAKADPARPANPEPGRPPADPKARAEREQAMRQRFEAMRDRTDQIQGRTVSEITQLLTKAQRTKFENMLGPPFDPRKVNEFGRPPRRPEGEKPGA